MWPLKSHPTVIAGFLIISGMALGLVLHPFEVEAKGIQAKIPFDPNPGHWFDKPQTQKQWEQEQAQKAKTAAEQKQAKREKARLKEEAQQQKTEAKRIKAEQSEQAKTLKKQKRNKNGSSENEMASSSTTTSAPATTTESTPSNNPNVILPPDKALLESKCEPIRLKIVTLNKQNRAAKAATFVERRKLMKAHETCLYEFSQKEIRYIKNFQFANKNNPSADPIPGKTATPVPKGATLRIDSTAKPPQIEPIGNTDESPLAPLKP